MCSVKSEFFHFFFAFSITFFFRGSQYVPYNDCVFRCLLRSPCSFLCMFTAQRVILCITFGVSLRSLQYCLIRSVVSPPFAFPCTLLWVFRFSFCLFIFFLLCVLLFTSLCVPIGFPYMHVPISFPCYVLFFILVLAPFYFTWSVSSCHPFSVPC